MAKSKKDKVWIVFHTYENGHQIDPFWSEKKAKKHAASISIDYLDPQDKDEIVFYKALYKRHRYDTILEGINVPELDDRCNVEILEEEVN